VAGAGAGGETVIVKDHDSAWVHAGIKKREAISGRLLLLDVDVDEGELPAGDFRKSFRYPTFHEASVGTIVEVLLRFLKTYGKGVVRKIAAVAARGR